MEVLPPLKALADPVRLNILAHILNHGDHEQAICPVDLITTYGLSQPTVSHHMKILVGAGLVTAFKRGTAVYYRLNPGTFEALAAWLAPYHDARTRSAP